MFSKIVISHILIKNMSIPKDVDFTKFSILKILLWKFCFQNLCFQNCGREQQPYTNIDDEVNARQKQKTKRMV